MRTQQRHTTQRAFALPTVLIASVVLITILAVSVTATTAVRTALKNQYYVQLAQVAGESGVAMAKACLAQSGNIPTWTDAKPLTPATDCAGNVTLSPSVKALVVAGGGSGGGSTGGGGGAGGVIYNPNVTIDEESFTVTVGGGGAAAGNQAHGKNGANSSFNGLTAIGGGGGGNTSSDSSADSGGSSGGSGGGGQFYHAASYASGNGTSGQGYAGGSQVSGFAAGGGGAGGVGGTSSGGVGGNGGPGIQNNITGAMIYYGAGGAGAANGIAGTGGSGDASSGASNAVGSPGRPNSGDGGGGGWNYTGGNSGAGGSGIVVISYPRSSGIDADGGTKIDEPTNPNIIHKFTSSGTFTVNSQGSATCPTDPGCSVTVSEDGTVRSSFTVPKPTVDATGRALTILNNGYTEILRKSNGSVWRTYRQPGVQNAVVPDLCSGNATSARGWNNAVLATQQDKISATSAAQTISLSSGNVYPGMMYFHKDFNISKTGTYDFSLYTGGTQDAAAAWLDGQLLATTLSGQSIASTSLVPGCHTLVVRLFNQSYLPRQSDFTAALTTTASATPIVVTDTSWRVSTGDIAHFSTNNYEEANSYEPVAVIGLWNNTALPWAGAPTDWGASSKDTATNWISTTYSSGSPASRPAPAYAWFRSPQFTLGSNSNVLVSSVCDNDCDLYLDGNLVFSADLAQGTVNKTINIGAGTHTFGLRLYNAGSSANSSAFLFAAANISAGNAIIIRSDASWHGTTSWTATAGNPYSYDNTFTPTPFL